MRLITAVLVALHISISPSAAAEITPVLSPAGPLAISPNEARKLFHQCSRNAPEPDGGVWFPERQEIDALETELSKYLLTVRFHHIGEHNQKWTYRGQYVGFVRSGAKYIYGSFMRVDGIIAENENPLSQQPRAEAIIWCDGGSNFWGIVYNPATGEFSDPRVNGIR